MNGRTLSQNPRSGEIATTTTTTIFYTFCLLDSRLCSFILLPRCTYALSSVRLSFMLYVPSVSLFFLCRNSSSKIQHICLNFFCALFSVFFYSHVVSFFYGLSSVCLSWTVNVLSDFRKRFSFRLSFIMSFKFWLVGFTLCMYVFLVRFTFCVFVFFISFFFFFFFFLVFALHRSFFFFFSYCLRFASPSPSMFYVLSFSYALVVLFFF